MTEFHNYRLAELEDLLPWERQVYIALLENYIEEENEKIRNS